MEATATKTRHWRMSAATKGIAAMLLIAATTAAIAASGDKGDAAGDQFNRAMTREQQALRTGSGTRIGELIEARARVVRRTRTLIFIEGTLSAGSRVLATGKGIWRLFPSGGT